MSAPAVSLVVIAYNMARELPRTLRTLSAGYQRGIAAADYEVIVVDNGSRVPFDEAACRSACPGVQIHYVEDAPVSPVTAINKGLACARGELVGVLIDGARMASPGLVAVARAAGRLHARPVIGTLAFHLGPDVQMRSVAHGYDQGVEDALLDSIDWTNDGYRLYSISVFAGSSAGGWFVNPSETNALFLRREQWQELGGYDPAFAAPGGGLVNLDTWARACAQPLWQPILLLGEATFHQFHGGVATNSPVSRWDEFHEEYVRIRGKPYARPNRSPLFVGTVPREAIPSLRHSLAALERSRSA